MKLELDSTGCQGHGRCYTLAPDLFDADDEGHSVLLNPSVSSQLEQPAREVVESCPQEAIALHD